MIMRHFGQRGISLVVPPPITITRLNEAMLYIGCVASLSPEEDMFIKCRGARLGQFASSCLLVIFVGCAGEPPAVEIPVGTLHPVKGSIETADGKKVTEGLVTFTPKKTDARSASAKLQSDGSFVLKTGDLDGAAEGEYIVGVDSELTVPGAKAGSSRPLVPAEFSSENSILPVNVKPGANDLTIKLVSPPKSGPGSGSNRD
jgi:hypothetical protein